MKALRDYLRQTEDASINLVLVLPLFAFYQFGILFTDGWRNSTDFFSGQLFDFVGGSVLAYGGFNFVVLVAVFAAYLKLRESGRIAGVTIPFLLAESTLYAVLLGGLTVRVLTGLGLSPMLATWTELSTAGPSFGLVDSIVLSVGAGTYEELFFRLVLLGGGIAAMTKVGVDKRRALVIGVIGTSLLFSAFHYVPFGQDPWQLWSFSFRFLLGIGLAALYLVRGFAVAVYTHTIYDLFVLVPRALGLTG